MLALKFPFGHKNLNWTQLFVITKVKQIKD